MLVSGGQQSDTVTYTDISVFFQIVFPYSLLQNIEYGSLCYTVGPCYLYVLYIVVYIYTTIYIVYYVLIPNS